jgi:glucose/arabinose dehydrogenase
MFVSVGSFSNVKDDENEVRRACILAFDPNGGGELTYASGLRNPVGLAVHPTTGELWTSVNERDELGDHLVPDYVTHVTEKAHYGWPWFYLGSHRDPRHEGKRPDLEGKITVPDVLFQSHSAAIDLAFYTGTKFPAEYHGDLFVALHGSWNRARRTGYKIVRVRMKDGHALGEYEDFVTGFVINEEEVWGRPAGVATAKDGALLFTEDGNSTIWRIAYTG